MAVLLVCTLIFVFDLQPPSALLTPAQADTYAQVEVEVRKEVSTEEDEQRWFSARIARPAVLAHRGSRYMQAENTLCAHGVALRYADVLEMDVQRTADGHLVVFHDDHLERVTNGTGRIADQTLEYLRSLDVAYHFRHAETYPLRGTGLRIPTLHEFLDRFHQSALIALELKTDDVSISEQILATLRQYPHMERRVVITSRHCAPLRFWREHTAFDTSACEHEAMLFYLLSRLRLARWQVLLMRLFLWQAEESAAPSTQQPVWPLDGSNQAAHSLEYRDPAAHWLADRNPLDPHSPRYYHVPMASGPIRLDLRSVVDDVHAVGRRINYWVVNEPADMHRLLDLGADGFVTDRFDVAHAVLAERGLRPPHCFDGQTTQEAEETDQYFVPSHNPGEVHGCVTTACRLAQDYLGPSLCQHLGLLIYSLLWITVLLGRWLLHVSILRPRLKSSAQKPKQH